MAARKEPAVRRTQQERTAESTRRLLDSAVELFSRNGYEATTAAEIALHAGYSRAMVNARFGTKEALLDHLLRTQYEERVAPPAPAGLTGVDAVVAVLDGLVALAQEDPRFLRAMLVLNFEAAGNTQTLRPRIADWVHRLEQRMVTALLAGQEDGTISTAVDAHVLARDTVNTGIGAAYTWIVMGEDHDFVTAFGRLRERVVEACTS